MPDGPGTGVPEEGLDCRSCGACCAYSETWPVLSPEDPPETAGLPRRLVDIAAGRMRSREDRCLALEGVVGGVVGCSVYAMRPAACRACQPGSASCMIARRWAGLSPALPDGSVVATTG